MNLEKKSLLSNNSGIYITILIFPLWSLYLSIKHFRGPQAKNLFWLFCIFLGMIHIYFPEGSNEADGYRYAARLIELHEQPVTWDNFASSFYSEKGFIDVYQPTITYLLSIVTNNPRWLFTIFAIVFGFFYSRNMWFVLDKYLKSVGFPLFLLLFYYILICPIWNINGVRMWTAFHVFIYGVLPYLYNSDKSKLIFCFISLFIHFSFIIPLTILVLYHFVPKSINVLLIFYLISFFIKEMDIEPIRNFLINNSPAFLSDRANSYTNEQTIQGTIEVKSTLNFYVDGARIFANWIITILLVVSCVWGKTIIKAHRELLNLFCFSLFIFAISNIISLIPSAGRFIMLSLMFSFASVILFYIYYRQNPYRHKGISMIFKFIPVLLLFPIVVLLRYGCDFYGFSLFLNPIAALFVEDNVPIIQFVKSII